MADGKIKAAGGAMSLLTKWQFWVFLALVGAFPGCGKAIATDAFAGLEDLTTAVLGSATVYMHHELPNVAEFMLLGFGLFLMVEAIHWHKQHPAWALAAMVLFAFVAVGGWELIASTPDSFGRQLVQQAHVALNNMGKQGG